MSVQHTLPKTEKKRQYDDVLTIFASNLAFEMTEDDIREVFGAMGPIKSVRLIRDRSQRSKGFAYIQYHDPEDLLRALALNQTTVRGRIINVARSRPPAKTATPPPSYALPPKPKWPRPIC